MSNNEELVLRVVGNPEAQARPRTFMARGRVVTHSPKTSWYHIVYTCALARRPITPFDGPLSLGVEYVFPRPKSIKADVFWKISKPDLDNLTKAVKDALGQAQWWVDDARVCRMMERKRYANGQEAPGALINVHRL